MFFNFFFRYLFQTSLSLLLVSIGILAIKRDSFEGWLIANYILASLYLIMLGGTTLFIGVTVARRSVNSDQNHVTDFYSGFNKTKKCSKLNIIFVNIYYIAIRVLISLLASQTASLTTQ